MIPYKAQTFIDDNLKNIQGGYSEAFESEYQIKVGDDFRFNKTFGRYVVIQVTVHATGTIHLLVSPRI